MKLTPLASNMTEIETEKYRVLFSYKTPVAYQEKTWDFKDNYFATDYKWSATTTRHINKWLNGQKAEIVSQEKIDMLLDEVK